jgi:hypothetical protein
MSEKEKNEPEKVSRRKFLRDAGFIVGGAALGIGGLSLTGCSTAPNGGVAGRQCPTTETSTQVNVEYIGECVCPNCDIRLPHQRGVPCRMNNCPKCGTIMVRGAI